MRAVEHPVKPKVRYYDKDMQDWARLYGLKIGHPTVFPVNSVKAMRWGVRRDRARQGFAIFARGLRGLLGRGPRREP